LSGLAVVVQFLAMLQKLSLKGIIVGAFLNVGGTIAWGVLEAFYFLLTNNLHSLPYTQQVSKLTSLMTDPSIVALNIVIGGGFSILGGYIAARIAKHDELLNATLSSFICILLALPTLGSASLQNIVLGIVANPLLSLLGGYLLVWQIKKKRKAKR